MKQFIKSVIFNTLLSCIVLHMGISASFAQGKTSKISVAVLNFEKNNLPQYIANSIRNTLEYKFTESRRFITLERRQIQRILNENKLQQNNYQKVTTILAADYFISGSVIRVKEHTVTAKVISGRDGSILFVYSYNFNDKMQYADAIDIIFRKIQRDISAHAKNIKPAFHMPPDIKSHMALNYIYPIGDFKDLTSPGLGFSLNVSFIRQNFLYGVETGFYNFPGDNDSFSNLNIIPLMASGGYRFIPGNHFTLTPSLSCGLFYLNKKEEGTSSSALEPGFTTGIKASVIITNNISAGIDASYMHIFESNYYIAGLHIGCGITFLF